jgi:hypothetical protein
MCGHHNDMKQKIKRSHDEVARLKSDKHMRGKSGVSEKVSLAKSHFPMIN